MLWTAYRLPTELLEMADEGTNRPRPQDVIEERWPLSWATGPQETTSMPAADIAMAARSLCDVFPEIRPSAGVIPMDTGPRHRTPLSSRGRESSSSPPLLPFLSPQHPKRRDPSASPPLLPFQPQEQNRAPTVQAAGAPVYVGDRTARGTS